jgi:serine/threonine-protein kinase
MTMRQLSPERWRRLAAILDEVLDLPAGARAGRLDVLCQGDPALRRDAEALIAADADAGAFLETPAGDYAADVLPPADAGTPADTSLDGRTVGSYRVVRELAHGGMGTVYLAERADGQFEQRVVLKLVKRGMDSDEIVRRFLAERQILARLQHPNIARLLDGGRLDTGQPYFAMEYVDGTSVTAYCEARGLDVGARLRLFLTVCDAVRYAHANLVVHRDLKPSNILVTDGGQPVLLDFGIAKVLGDGADETGTLTALGFRVLTPEYAAPEQVTGAPVTTATDVYGLGAVLYELLTGRRPHQFAHRTPSEVERVIVREDPAPPGTIARHLRGDLDTVVLRALHKDPARRYPSVEALAEDLRRHLAGLPVAARQDSMIYRAGKFVRRHRVGVSAAAVAGAALLAGVAGTLWQARVARAEARTAGAVKDFLISLFQAAGPDEARGREITARELLEVGTRRLDSASLTEQPEVRAEILGVLGTIHRDLGLYARSDSLFARAEEIQRRMWGDEDARVAATLRSRGRAAIELGNPDRADSLMRRALALHRRTLASDDPELAVTLSEVAGLERLLGNFAAAESLFTEALAIDRARFGEDHLEVATDLANLAVAVSEAGDPRRAAELQRQALAVRRRQLPAPHPALATTLGNLAGELRQLGEHEEAEQLARESLAMRRQLYGNGHPDVAYSLNGLALILEARGRLDQAAPLYREALDVRRAALGPENPEYVTSVNNFGTFSWRTGDLAAAAAAVREALERWTRSLGPDHPNTMTAMNNLGVILSDSGAYDEADRLLAEAVRGRRRVRGERHLDVGQSLRALGVLRHRQRRLPEAERVLREAVDIIRERLPQGHPRVAEPLVALGAVLTEAGRPGEAEPLLREALALRIEGFGPDDTRTALARRELGACLTALRRHDEAEDLLLAAHARLTGDPYAWRERAPTARRLATLYARWGKPAQAARYR